MNTKVKYLIIVFLLLGIGAGAWFFYSKSLVAQENQTQIKATTQDPIADFLKEFKKNNYLVKVKAKSNTNSIDQEFYFDHGNLVRIGGETQAIERTYFIVKNETIFSVKPSDKSFKSFTLDSEQGKAIFDGLSYMFLLNPLMEDALKNNFKWQNQGQGKYVFEQKWDMKDNANNSLPVYVEVVVNNDKLISDINISEDNKSWENMNFSYEFIDDLGQKLIFPSDYIKTN